MKKRILTGLLACCLSLSLTLPGLAAGSIPAQEEVAQVITALGIMAGDAKATSICPGQSTGPNLSPWP